MFKLLRLAAVASLALAVSASANDIGKKLVCPVTKKQVIVAKETPMVRAGGANLYFADAASRATFLKAPERYLKTGVECPVRNIKGRANKNNRLVVNDQIVYFCCGNCSMGFAKEPNNYFFKLTDVVTGKEFEMSAEAPKVEYKGGVYFFESDKSKADFEKEPTKYAKVVLQ